MQLFSKVITAQSAAQKRAEEAAVFYNFELTGLSRLPRDDSEKSKREFVMWCTEQAGIPAHEVSAIEYVDMKRSMEYKLQSSSLETKEIERRCRR